MMVPLRAMLVIGSPRWRRSTSHTLGRYLFDRLYRLGFDTEMVWVHRAVRLPVAAEAFAAAMSESDIVVLAAPVCLDSLPAPVVEAMERAARRLPAPDGRRRQLLVILDCELPGAGNCDVAAEICKRFAAQTGLEWLGALSMGESEVIGERDLDRLGKRSHRLRGALNLAVAAVVKGRPVPPRACEMMAKPLVPRWWFNRVSRWRSRREARRHGVRRLDARPFRTPAPTH